MLSLMRLCGAFCNKILTSARNGELIMWDLNKNGSKYGECFPDHMLRRSAQVRVVAVPHVVGHVSVLLGISPGESESLG